MRRGGTADLPLHHGRVPPWLAERMTRLGRAITEAIVSEYGKEAFLSRLSDPFWFQAFGAVMGMDWHSSGITTSVMGALKRGLNPLSRELGLFVCGGRGKHSRKTPDELIAISDRFGLNGDELVRASRLSAKVDNTCLQDGFSIYLHCFVVTDQGTWAVVQQGMNDTNGMARRYHWHSKQVSSFVSDPQAAVVGQNQGQITNMSDHRAAPAQRGILDFLAQHPDQQRTEMRRLLMPRHHDVRPMDVDSKRLGAVLATAYEQQYRDFSEALLTPGLGPRTLQSLALVAEVIHGAPHRFSDPARFSFAHGGKDGHPFPVPLRVYDESLSILRRALDLAKLDRSDRLEGFKKLDRLVRLVEVRAAPHADVKATIRKERREAADHGGRTVFDKRRPDRPDPEQLELF